MNPAEPRHVDQRPVDLSTDAAAPAERRRLVEAHLAAGRFYRRELLRAHVGWPVEYLREQGLERVRDVQPSWKVGYPPDAWARLTEHLGDLGFDSQTLVRAGLSVEIGDGAVVDAFRDRLMLVAWSRRLNPVGFVGLREGAQPEYAATATTLIHRRSHALLGVQEQKPLLDGGAIPVVVNDVVDASAIEKIEGAGGRRWVGIPLCDAGLSTAQANMLRLHSSTRSVVVALTDDQDWRRAVVSTCLSSLSMFFDRVLATELPAGHTPLSLSRSLDGAHRLDELLSGATRPLAGYRLPGGPHLDPLTRPAPAADDMAPGL